MGSIPIGPYWGRPFGEIGDFLGIPTWRGAPQRGSWRDQVRGLLSPWALLLLPRGAPAAWFGRREAAVLLLQ